MYLKNKTAAVEGVCAGEAVICALSKEGLTKWVLFSGKHCQRSEPAQREKH